MSHSFTKNCLHCGNPFESCRSTKKYCSDTCKLLAYYKRNGVAPIVTDSLAFADKLNTVKQPLNRTVLQQPVFSEEFEQLPSAEITSDKTLNDKPPKPPTVNQSLILPEEYYDEDDEDEDEEEAEVYNWVGSRFLSEIDDYIEKTGAVDKFRYPKKYWETFFVLPRIKWVSLRLRCLMETIIRLNHLRRVDHKGLLAVKQAFTTLISSRNFKDLPHDYHFTTLAKEWEQKLAMTCATSSPKKSIEVRLKRENRIECIAVRYMLADLVPAVKFSELDFRQ